MFDIVVMLWVGDMFGVWEVVLNSIGMMLDRFRFM